VSSFLSNLLLPFDPSVPKMPSYLVTGASRGLGYEFIRQFSFDPTNQVFGLVRNKPATDKKIAEDGLKNITIIEADIIDRRSLQAAKVQLEEVTGGSLDYLINNAAFLSAKSAFNSLTDFADEPEVLDNELWTCFNTNVVGVINTINTFLPLIQKSQVKKVISISTGFADNDLVADFDLYEAAPYSISKAALNMASAKYAARHGKDGILFLAISPGLVATGNGGARKSIIPLNVGIGAR
jgi:NAD(P)-dependent dehydrogenase (short-subunit alcohol dehydrogenase family)